MTTIAANRHRFAARPGRTIIVNGARWKWQCGKGGGVIAYSEDGQRAYAKAWEIKGSSPHVFGRGQWKQTSDGMLTPADIEGWLSDEMRWKTVS